MFNWGDILSLSISKVVTKSSNSTRDQKDGFFMLSYLMDIVCMANQFLGMS